jgi:phosphate transport system substrate-binding protein
MSAPKSRIFEEKVLLMFESLTRTLKAAVLAALGLAMLGGVAAQAQVNGAGATFPAPLYLKWFQEYHNDGGPAVNYQAVGSGAGIKDITAHAVDFGASDAPMNAAEMAAAPGILHIPTVAGAVVIAYNIPKIGPGLSFSSSVIADIFLGKITKWNDPAIAKINHGINLPNLAIAPVHRADSSGTNNIFTTYLSDVSSEWSSSVGAGKSVHWPNGLGAKGNQGVAQYVKTTEGGIGYIELNYAVQNNITYGPVRNAKGKFIYPTVESTTIAVDAVTLPADFRKVATNTSALNGYPITGFTYVLAYKNGTKPEVKKLLEWMLTTGQKDASPMSYSPLPAGVKKRALAAIESIH